MIAKADVEESGHFQVAAGIEQTDGYNIINTGNGTQYGFDGQNLMAGYEHQLNEQWVGYFRRVGLIVMLIMMSPVL